MTTEDSPPPKTNQQQDSGGIKTETPAAPPPPPDSLSSQRVFKKSSPNNKLTMYLSSRDLVVSCGRIDRLEGVLLVDAEFIDNRKVYGQVTLTFRYGREDEEVMGLKFCNEAIMCLLQLYPPHPAAQPPEGNSLLQEALLKRLGPNAYPFSMEITPLAPPSVQLVPAKEYNGAPIGTSYDVRAYVADRADEKFHRKTTVRMGIRVVQRAFAPPSPHSYNPAVTFLSTHPLQEQQAHKKAALCKSAPPMEKFTAASRMLNREGREEFRLEARSMELNVTQGDYKLTATTPPQQGLLTVEYRNERNDVENQNGSNKQESGRVSFEQNCLAKETTITRRFDKESVGKVEAALDYSEEDASMLAVEQQHETDKSADKEHEKEFRSLCSGKRASVAAYLAGVPPPRATLSKPFLLSEGKVTLTASLDKAIYSHGEEIKVFVQIKNNSNKSVRRIKVFVVQHVDVCMFSNGKFKNVVAMINSKDHCPIGGNSCFEHTFILLPVKSSTKNWIALEDSYTKQGTSLASTVTCTTNNPEERNVFAIYVSYYVKVKLLVSVMGGEVAIKLPFTLMHTCSDYDNSETLTRVTKPEVQEPEMCGRCGVLPEIRVKNAKEWT